MDTLVQNKKEILGQDIPEILNTTRYIERNKLDFKSRIPFLVPDKVNQLLFI